MKKEYLDTLILKIDISKCNNSVREIMNFISSLEKEELNKKDLKIKDIYFDKECEKK